jgi:hypothetical protein
MGKEPYDRKVAWPSINHLILSDACLYQSISHLATGRWLTFETLLPSLFQIKEKKKHFFNFFKIPSYLMEVV